MKKFISGLIIGMMLMCAMPSLAKTDTVQAIYNGVKIAVNGKTITFASGDEPVSINNRTYVPAKYVAEALGATVGWDGKNNTVTITSVAEKVAEPSAPSITSDAVKTVPTPTIKDPHENRNGEMNLSTEKTSDGLNIYTFNNESQQYVLSNDLNIYKNVKMGITRGVLYNSDSRALKNADGSKDLIPVLEYWNINDLKCFTLEYYENTILPVIKAEGK